MRTNRALLVTGIGVLLAFLPGKVQALAPASSGPAWGSVWQVYEGAWPLPHQITGGADTTACATTVATVPAAVFSVSALGNMQASGQPMVFGQGGGKMGYFTMAPGSISTYGSALSVPAGTAVRLDWACQNYTYCAYGSACSSHNHWGNCDGATGNLYGSFYGSSNYGLTGASTVYPATTTTYTLSCNPAAGSGWYTLRGTSLSLTVYVTPACGTPIEDAGSSGGYMLKPRVKRRLNAAGYNVCLTNNTDNTYFVPARTNAEAASFINNASRLGVTVQ